MNPPDALRKGPKDKISSTLRKPLNRQFPLCIEAISVTCGGDLREQLAAFIKQVHFFHPELPLHIATDLEGYESVNSLIRPQDKVWITKASDRERYAKSKSKDHGKRWNKAWIGIKLENFKRAIEHFKCGVLQCDSDFVFTRSMSKQNWNADVVMSTHVGPIHRRDVPELHGAFNAGMLLSDKLFVAERWIKLYEEGYGGFYEQKLLEKFSELYVVDLFPSDWNWGPWRHAENIVQNKRVPTIIHAHVIGPHRHDSPTHKAAEREYLKTIRSYNTHPKLAFYHASKAGGSEMMRIVDGIVTDRLRYQSLNSFKIGTNDWTESELLQICHGTFKYQEGNRWIVHNHGQSWSANSIDEFLKNDWKFWGMYRPIRDRLLSFYYWSMDNLKSSGKHPMSGRIIYYPTVNEFLEQLVTSKGYKKEWALPHRYEEMKWYPCSDMGLIKATKDHFNLILSRDEVSHTNRSSNIGWDDAVACGIITKKTVDLINNLDEVKQWDEFIDYANSKI
jgi:hypothetical protein